MTAVRPQRPLRLLATALALVPFALPPAAPAAAQSDEDLAEDDRIRELERKVEILSDELARTRQDMAVPEDADDLESFFGLGPGASKIYGIGKGLSIGGYAEGRYTAIVDDKRKSGEVNRFDALRTVLYVGYKFTDHIVWNSEFEFEHATSSSTESAGSGSVSVEFATLDFLIRDEVNARAGLMLVPMGFITEVHEPPFFYGTHRPEVERQIIPSTWRENGAGLFGSWGDFLDYKLYTITSFNGAGFDAGGLRGGRQKGNRALAEDMAFVGRVDVHPLPELTLGGSVFVGNTGQNQDVPGAPVSSGLPFPDARLVLWEAHGELRTHGLKARALVTMAHLDDAGALSRVLQPTALGGTGDIAAGEGIAEQMIGAYGEVGYEVLQWLAPGSEWSVEPFVRFEFVDTQNEMPAGFVADESNEFEVYTVGLHVKPIPNVVLKMDYRNRVARSGALGDEFNLGIGVVF